MNQPLLVTAAIIEKDNKILLTKRARSPFKDYWCFIGGCGGFEKTADPKEAVKIEVNYDINCEFNPKFFTYNLESFDSPSITLFFQGTIKGTPKINPEAISEYKWFDKQEALKLNLGFDHKTVLKKYLETFSKESN